MDCLMGVFTNVNRSWLKVAQTVFICKQPSDRGRLPEIGAEIELEIRVISGERKTVFRWSGRLEIAIGMKEGSP